MKFWAVVLATCSALILSATSAAASPSGFVSVWQPKFAQATLLTDVSASGPHNAWAVGWSQGGAGNAVVEHWDGAAWTIQPVASGSSTLLNSVAAISSKDVWAVGRRGDYGAVAHWDGAAWRAWVPKAAPATSELMSVSALSASDVWAFGRWVSSDDVWHQLVLRWNGSSWRMVASAAISPFEARASAVISDTNVWTLGSWGVEHLSGFTWSPDNPPCCDSWGMTATPSGQVLVVGEFSQLVGYYSVHVSWWHDGVWRVDSIGPYADEHVLIDASALTDSDVWAVGWRDNGNVVQRTLILHWDGVAWTDLGGPNVGTGDNVLEAVAHVPGTASEMWAVGFHDSQPLILHHP